MYLVIDQSFYIKCWSKKEEASQKNRSFKNEKITEKKNYVSLQTEPRTPGTKLQLLKQNDLPILLDIKITTI